MAHTNNIFDMNTINSTLLYIMGDEQAAHKRISCGPRSIQARPAVITFVCCLFLLMNNFFFRFHGMIKKLCGPLTQR